MSTEMKHTEGRAGRVLARGVGRAGRVAISWSVSGGLLLGGFLVAAMTLAGRLSGNALLLTSSGLFLIGAALGFLHGAVLGFLGRPEGQSRGDALSGLALSILYDVPVLLVGLVVSGWIAMTVVAVYMNRIAPMVGVVVAWAVGAVLVLVAVRQGWVALKGAYARWPERRLGTVLTAGVFAALMVLFVAQRPVIWGLQMQVTAVGAVLLALAATFWLGGPAVTVALKVVRRIPGLSLSGANAGSVPANVGIGVVTGILLGLIAVPFYGSPFGVSAIGAGVGTVGAMIQGLGQALVNEVLLRLVLVSGLAWLLLRRLQVGRGTAAAVAVAIAAAVQVALYVPAALSIGFPSGLVTAGFLAVTVAIPAVTFGILFWKRGFGTALLADAAAVIALILLAAV
ncbi:MAG: hypothetical protein P8174_10530 [Gemmatimonadota bacterium]